MYHVYAHTTYVHTACTMFMYKLNVHTAAACTMYTYLTKDFFPSTQLNNPPRFYLPRARFARPHKNFMPLLQ